MVGYPGAFEVAKTAGGNQVIGYAVILKYAKCPYQLVLYMQYVKCPYYSRLYMQSDLIIQCFI